MGFKVALRDIAAINSKSYSTKEAWNYIEYIDTGSVTHGKIDTIQHLNAGMDKVPSRARRKVKDRSIIYSTVRPNQEHYALLKSPSANTLVSTGFAVIDCDVNKVIPEYCYYVLTQKSITEFFQGLAEQSVSTYPTLSTNDLASLEFEMPSLEIQRKICEVLGSLDQRIFVNSKLNDYLEGLFALQYKHFIDEEKCNCVPLTDVIFFQEGPGIRNWQYVYDGNGVNFINIRCIQNHNLNLSAANQISIEEAYGKYKHFLVEPGDILMSSSGTLGRYAIARPENLPLCMNTSVIRFQPLVDPEAYAYVYGYLTSQEFYSHLTSMATGSAQVNFGPTHLKKIEVPLPSNGAIHRFNLEMMPVINLMNSLHSESGKLMQLRDAVLPKLMSGEIDVSKVDLTQPNHSL